MQKIALYRKYRPEDFDSTIGQDHITIVLKNAILEQKTSHAYLFSGPRGTGKTSVARILAKAVNCNDRTNHNPCGKCNFCVAVSENRVMDLVEIDAASNRGIDEIRELREKVKFSPTDGTYKVFIIDEVHMLTKEAFNALLKTLEEPPSHVIFILATTEINKVPATIISRCQRHDFKRIKMNDIVAVLSTIVKKEKMSISEDALETVAEMSEGGLRDAISILDQLSSMGSDRIEAQDVESALGLAPNKTVAEFVSNLLFKKQSESLKVLEEAQKNGVDIINLARNSIEFLRKLVSVKLGNEESIEGTKEQIISLNQLAGQVELYQIVELSEDFLWTQNAFRTNVDPKAILTVLCAKSGLEKFASVSATKPTKQTAKVAQKVVRAQGPDGKWQHFLMEVKAKNNTIHAFLRVARPEFVDENIVLTFPYKFHKERIEESKTKRFVEDTLKRVYGQELILVCRMDGNGGVNHQISDVNSAASILGGEIVD